MVLKTSDSINHWLTTRNCFEWTTLRVELESKSDIKIYINYDDTKDKVAGELFNHWTTDILLKNVKEIYRKYSNWSDEQKKLIQVKETLNMVEYIEKVNNSKAISIKPVDNVCGLYFDDWMSDASCTVEAEEIEIVNDRCEVVTLRPKISNTIISFTYLKQDFPSNKFWIDELKNEGLESSFIEYFLNPVDIKEVPEYDYDRWSIRPNIPKGEFPFGVNICCIERKELTIRIIFELQEEKLIQFFDKLKIVASKRNLLEVKCGNVLFTDVEWRQYLETKEITR